MFYSKSNTRDVAKSVLWVEIFFFPPQAFPSYQHFKSGVEGERKTLAWDLLDVEM